MNGPSKKLANAAACLFVHLGATAYATPPSSPTWDMRHGEAKHDI